MPHALRTHHIAGVEPDVAVLEGVADQFLLGGGLVGVAVEGREPADRADQQARLAGRHPAHPAVRVAHRISGGGVVLDVGQRKWVDPGGSRDVEDVDERRVALAGGVELDHPLDPEALGELVPDVRAQTVADDHPHMVFAVGGLGRLIEQIPAQFADVDERGGLGGDHLVPEHRGRERLAQCKGGAGVEHR